MAADTARPAGRGASLVVILCGGDKSDQDRDIARAKALAREITE